VTVAGCSASRPLIRDIYLLDLKYTNSSTAEGFNLRVGYFGLCLKRFGDSTWTCNPHGGELGIPGLEDPLDIVGTAQRFKDQVVFPGLL